jgi:hypothetical protein
MSHKYVTKVVWYILVQLSSLNNTEAMVSGVSVQVSDAMNIQRTDNKGQSANCLLSSLLRALSRVFS